MLLSVLVSAAVHISTSWFLDPWNLAIEDKVTYSKHDGKKIVTSVSWAQKTRHLPVKENYSYMWKKLENIPTLSTK